ncbi:MAG: hypothetical protein ACRBCS_08060 [Cellvibrionaceae bacterium]
MRREKGVFRALNLLVAAILDSYDKTKTFGHEQPISTIDTGVLDKEWLSKTKIKFKEKESDFLKLKYAMETAYTRLDDCRHALSMASSVSPEAGVQWLQITDRVRLLAEEYGQQPEVPVEKLHLVNKDIEENPLYLYRLALMQRIHQLIVDVEVWLDMQNG